MPGYACLAMEKDKASMSAAQFKISENHGDGKPQQQLKKVEVGNISQVVGTLKKIKNFKENSLIVNEICHPTKLFAPGARLFENTAVAIYRIFKIRFGE